MFGFKKKHLELTAPISGKTINLSDVPDEVFAQKLAGDGLAIEPTGNTVYAPADGTITVLLDSNHAFGMSTREGIDILVHVGLDTVSLKGEGFKRLVSQGDEVKKGTPILEIDRELILSKGLPLITPVLITNHTDVKTITPHVGIEVVANETVVLECKK